MRLIGEFQDEKEAFGFQVFLQNHGIKSLYEPTKDALKTVYRLWVVEEDEFDPALAYYQEWRQDPSSPRFQASREENSLQRTAPLSNVGSTHAPWKVRVEAPPVRSPFSLNNFMVLICSFFFIWYGVQAQRMVKTQGTFALEYGYRVTPIQKVMLFDYPAYLAQFESFFQQYDIKTSDDLKKLPPKVQERFSKIKDAPAWNGLADMIVTRDWTLVEKLPEGTLFGKIREGELWRLITPVFLHAGWLHLLFNMAWLFILGRQIEERIGKFRYLLLSLLLGVIANVAQYLVSGPMFLGYSGIITGMVGFIWARQRIAPWEGYPLQRSVIVFISIFVVAMLILEVISMALQFFQVTQPNFIIANTAHIIGGLFGVFLGYLSLFARSRR